MKNFGATSILGLKVIGHDTGAALISGGKIVAISEERLCRIKYAPDIFPEQSIFYCLDALGVSPKEVDIIAIVVGPGNRAMLRKIYGERLKHIFPKARLEFINHHDSHAATAFFCSPFEEAAVLVYDGQGESLEMPSGLTAPETETVYLGKGKHLYEIQKTRHLREKKIWPYTWGIGRLYAFLSNKYLGMGNYNEGKMMGLAPYGNGSLLKKFPLDLWVKEKDGYIFCNSRVFFPYTVPPRFDWERPGTYFGLRYYLRVAKNFLETRVVAFFARKQAEIKILIWRLSAKFIRVYKHSEIFVESRLFRPVYLMHPARTIEKLPDEYYASIAYLGQKVLERVAALWGRRLKELTVADNICIAGGTGLNIDANRLYLDEAGFKHIFVQPASSDAGLPLGCILWAWHMILGKERFWVMKSAELGRKYGISEVEAALKKFAPRIEVKKSDKVAEDTAKLIANSKIVGWFYGGSEYGPRALGNRSILCDARDPQMKDTLNNKVKHREPWRPFAAAVLREHQREWFELEEESPFMLLAANVPDAKRSFVPSIVHVDGTCRIQSVTKEANGRYYDLIAAFHKITGIPLVLNTSFNLAGEPIVETPEDALNCFLNTKMDYLVIEEYIISKKGG